MSAKCRLCPDTRRIAAPRRTNAMGQRTVAAAAASGAKRDDGLAQVDDAAFRDALEKFGHAERQRRRGDANLGNRPCVADSGFVALVFTTDSPSIRYHIPTLMS